MKNKLKFRFYEGVEAYIKLKFRFSEGIEAYNKLDVQEKATRKEIE